MTAPTAQWLAAMAEWLTAGLLVCGSLFVLLAALGVARMPDLFTRMQPATKATTLGMGCLLLAVTLATDDPGVRTRAVAAIVFVLLTAPVAAHMIGRAGYLDGAELWDGTLVDEWQGRPAGGAASRPTSSGAADDRMA